MITPKFNVGQIVFIYEGCKLVEKEVQEIITRTKKDSNKVEYLFKSTNIFGRDYGTGEKEVFASKEDFINNICQYENKL